MSKFLITGGAGFIGSNFLRLMVNKYTHDDYVCVDSLTYAGSYENLRSLLSKKNFKFVCLNICNRKGIYELFKKEQFDFVINFAAESHVDRSIRNPNIFMKTNILGTQVLLDACRIYGIKRYHQVSTDEVYGDLPLGRNEINFTESSPLNPSSPYSTSKAAADLLVLSYHRTYNLPVTISRCSNNYGPYQFPEKLIPLTIINALANKKIPLYGNGENIREWIYVEDHCEAIDLIVRKGRNGEVYNIANHNEFSNLEIVKIILKELNKQDSLIEFVRDRPGHDLRYSMNFSKISSQLKYKPKYSFGTSIKITIKWYLDNQYWINNIKNKKMLYK